jgi:two-component system nitrate/nitrite response regulator NarL
MTWRKNLSPRESDVALLVARGLSNKEVAREMELSNGTVKTHVHNIFQKLGAENRYTLILLVGSPDAPNARHLFY